MLESDFILIYLSIYIYIYIYIYTQANSLAHGLAAWAKLNNSHGLKSSISDWVYFSPHWKQMNWAVTAFCDFYFSVEYNQLTKKRHNKIDNFTTGTKSQSNSHQANAGK